MKQRKFNLSFILLLISAFSYAQNAGPAGIETSAATGVVFWLRGDLGVTGTTTVTQWADQANSNNATPGTGPELQSSYANMNNQDVIDFVGASNEQLGLPDNVRTNTNTNWSAQTFFVTFRTGSDVSATQYIFEEGGNSHGMSLYIKSGNVYFNIWESGAGVGNRMEIHNSVSANTNYIVYMVYNAGALSGQINGAGFSNSSGSTSSPIASHGGNITIGDTDNTTRDEGGNTISANNDFTGHIAEMIYYDRVLNTAELQILNNYLSARYAITLSANDYYDESGATTYINDVIGIGQTGGVSHTTSTGNGGTLFLDTSSGMGNGDFAFAGHDNSSLTKVSTDIGTVGYDRLNRSWRVEKTGSHDIRIEFDVVAAGLGATPASINEYDLLYRASTGVDFTILSSGVTKSLNGDQFRFTITDANFATGFYTIAVPQPHTWTSYTSGNWDTAGSWTLDPSGQLYENPSGYTPATSPTASQDKVVIKSGKTITMTNNNKSNAQITVDGVLDIAATTGHSFTTIKGSGLIKCAENNFPSGTATHFISAGQGEGTVEYYGTSDITYSGTGTTTFYNLKINLTGTAANDDFIVTASNVTINGNLDIVDGEFRINNTSNSSSNKRTITVNGNLNVQAGAEISTGTGNVISDVAVTDANYFTSFHQLILNGNFINNGTCNFSNLTAPDYNSFTNNGATTVTFNGATDNNVILNGVTNFYNLLIDKGTDQTFILTINSSSVSNFMLFGRNDYTTTGLNSNADPTISGKALWIKTGTLKLTGTIHIPSLAEGITGGSEGEWFIPSKGGLWIDGNNVNVYVTAESNAQVNTELSLSGTDGVNPNANANEDQGTRVYGTFRISNGLYHARNGTPLSYVSVSDPIILIEGGTVEVPRIRKHTGTGGSPSYIQTGGTVNLIGRNNGGPTGSNSSIFELVESTSVFHMSGGEMILKDIVPGSSVTNGMRIASTAGYFNVTGGTITIDAGTNLNTSSNNFELELTTTNLWNLKIKSTGSYGIRPETDLDINNDLIIESGALLRMRNNANSTTYDMTIAGDINLDGSLDTNDSANKITFDGTSPQTLTLSGTFTNDLQEVIFGTTSAIINITGTMGAFNVQGPMTIQSTTELKDGGFTINVKSSLTNSGTHTTQSNGKIKMNGSSAQTIGGDGTGIFGNLEIDNSNGVSFSASQSVMNTLTLTTGILDINTEGLTMSGANASIGGSSFSNSKMIQTAGNVSDLGLTMYLDANETLTFPIGTNANATVRYTPLIAVFSSYSDNGYINLSVADDVLPTTDGSGGTMLSYYWHIEHSGFTAVPKVTSYTFSGVESDDGTGNVNTYPNSWRGGKVLSDDPYTRSHENNTSINNPTGHDINMDGDGTPFDLENADYSAGPSNRWNGKPDVYYSKAASAGPWYTWNTNANWSTDPVLKHQGPDASDYPKAGDIAVIGHIYTGGGTGRHQFRGTTNITVAKLVFDSQAGASPQVVNSLSRVSINLATTLTAGSIVGVGELVPFIRNNGSQTQGTVVGDVGDFNNEANSGWFYWIRPTTNTRITVNDQFNFPGLRVFGGTQNAEITWGGNFTSLSMVIDNTATLVVTNDFNVTGEAKFGDNRQGSLLFDNNGSNDTFTCGSLFFKTPSANNNSLSVDNSGTDEDKLIVKGDFTINNASTLDLYTGNSNVILELQGTGAHTFTNTSGTTPDFYRIAMNKGSDTTATFTFNDDFNLSGPSNGATKALEMQNGLLTINDAGIDINLSTGSNDFTIPTSAGLVVNDGTIRISGANTGVELAGLLRIQNNGVADFADASNNNYIEYTGSGQARLEVKGSGSLTVGSQIRRSTATSGGALNYVQTGGIMIVGNNALGSSARAMFEIRNPGSSFTFTGGAITVKRTSNTSGQALYLDPATSSVSSGTTINIGTASPTSQTMGIYSTAILHNLTVTGTSNVARLDIVPLTLNGNLSINSNATFNANGKQLTIKGNYTNSSGTFTANSNTTIFSGSATQTLSGSSTFYNITKNASNTVTLASGTDITISNNLRIESGTLADNDNFIYVAGDLYNVATHNSSGATDDGITLNGSSDQTVSGTGIYGRLTISNDAIVEDDLVITDKLKLNGGIFNVQGNLLTMNLGASFEAGQAFSNTNMVQTNVSFTDSGIKKTFPAGASNFTYPIGSGTRYTPLTFTISANGNSTGSITLRAAKEIHPSIVEDSETPNTSIVDASNALQYHWILSSSGITGFSSTADFDFILGDASLEGGTGYTLANYTAARLFASSITWDRAFSQSSFNESTKKISVTMSSASDATISGDYTAGINVNNSDVVINGAIPDNVPVFETVGTGGNYSVSGTWNTAPPAGGPVGAVVTVKSGDVLTLNNDNVKLLRTIIESGGELVIDGTIGHRLGTVTGTGKITVNSNTTSANLPAGYYDDFFKCGGGSIEYGGSGTYDILSGINTMQSLTVTGGGTKKLPNDDITVCEDLTISSSTTLDNINNKNINVTRDLLLTSGTFNSGNGSIITVGRDLTATSGALTVRNNTGVNITDDFTINGVTATVGTNSNITVSDDVLLTTGSFTGNLGSFLKVGGDLTRTSATFTANDIKVEFNGAAHQYIVGDFTGANAFDHMRMNNTSPTGADIRDGGDNDIFINKSLILDKGHVVTDSDNDLTIALTATATAGNLTSYITGPVKKIMDAGDSFVFPTGKGSRYGQIKMSDLVINFGNDPKTFTAEYFSDNPQVALGSTIDPSFIGSNPDAGISGNEYWTLSDGEGANASTASVELRWNTGSDVSEITGELSDLRVMFYNGSQWNSSGNNGEDSGDQTLPTASDISFSSKSISFGTIDMGTNPLPVQMTLFTAEIQLEDVMIYWATVQEIRNDHYDVERSRDGVHFESIGTVKGLGNSNVGRDYSFLDKDPYPGLSYYRLKQTDFNGEFKHSKVVQVRNINKSSKRLVIFPNPTEDANVHITLEGLNRGDKAILQISDMQGRQMYFKKVLANDLGMISEKIEDLHLISGLYIVTIFANGEYFHQKLKIED